MKTFWDNNHPLQAVADQLQNRIPVSGEVEDAAANPALEEFRKGMNLYYEIFNNGCMNRSDGSKKYFGIPGSEMKRLCRIGNWKMIHGYTEPGMEKLVIAAAVEQLAKGN